jgi:hypothetical protein
MEDFFFSLGLYELKCVLFGTGGAVLGAVGALGLVDGSVLDDCFPLVALGALPPDLLVGARRIAFWGLVVLGMPLFGNFRIANGYIVVR